MQPGEVKVGDHCLERPEPTVQNQSPVWEPVVVISLGKTEPARLPGHMPASGELDQQVVIKRKDGSVLGTWTSQLKPLMASEDIPVPSPGPAKDTSPPPGSYWFECKACGKGFRARWSLGDDIRCSHCDRLHCTSVIPVVGTPRCDYPID